MDDWHRQEYAWYVQGCATFQWSPLEEAEFVKLYNLYREAHGFLKDHGYRTDQASGITRLLIQIRWMPMAHRMRCLEQQLGFLSTAIASGRSDDENGSGQASDWLPNLLLGSGARQNRCSDRISTGEDD